MQQIPGVPVREGLFSVPESGKASSLIGSKCSRCGLVCFPQRTVCPTCLTDDTVSQIQLSGRAKLEVCVETTVSTGAIPAPYVQAYVVLEEGPRIYSYIEAGIAQLKEGMDLQVEIGPVGGNQQGGLPIGYKFRPRKEAA